MLSECGGPGHTITADKTKASLRLKRKRTAWKDDVRMRILGFTSQ